MVVPLVVAALRSVALKAAGNAASKVRRLEKQGITIAGTVHDPRRAVENVKRYNRKQLDTYISELQEFTKRSTKFVKGSQGAPIPLLEYSLYKAQESIYNEVSKRFAARNAELLLPGQAMTVGERSGQTTQSSINAPDNTILPRKNRGAESFPSAEKVRKSRNLLEQRMSARYVDFRRRSASRAIDKGLTKVGAEDIKDRFRALSSRQKEALIFDYDFMELVFQRYPEAGGGSVAMNNKPLEDALEWAEGLFNDEEEEA